MVQQPAAPLSKFRLCQQWFGAHRRPPGPEWVFLPSGPARYSSSDGRLWSIIEGSNFGLKFRSNVYRIKVPYTRESSGKAERDLRYARSAVANFAGLVALQRETISCFSCLAPNTRYLSPLSNG